MSTWDGTERRMNDTLVARIHSVELSITKLTEEIRNEKELTKMLVAELSALTRDHHVALYGNSQCNGMKEEVILLKESDRQRKFHLNTITVAVVGTVVNTIFNWFKRSLIP